MLFSLDSQNVDVGAKLLIEPEVVSCLMKFRQLKVETPESGGILLGYRKSIHLHVTQLSYPNRDDKQTRFSFFREAKNHEELAVKRWVETNETLDYLGEWHTHPEDHPQPSLVDLKSWREISSLRAKPMVFLIIGRKSNWFGLGVGGEIRQLLSFIK